MKTNRFISTAWIAAAIIAAVGVQGFAATPTLKVGDNAPKLQTGKWVQGDPVKELEKGTAYLVEFWATWCGPCRVSIPHLNELHSKFKDRGLVVIGQDCWEQDESLVKPFVEKMGDKMTYRVALDDKADNEKGKMAETWMEAAGRNGIPSAFLVDRDGKIAWIGHPMQLKEDTIEEVLAGKFDMKKAAADAEKREAAQAAIMKLAEKLGSQMQDKNWDKAEETIGEMSDLLPEGDRSRLNLMRLNVKMERGDYPAAFRLAKEISDANPNEPMLQNQIAWELATREGIKDRNLDVLETIATRANNAAQGKDPAIADTLARVLFLQGKREDAIKLQRKAVDLADGDMKEQLEKTLASYRDGKVPE